MSENVDTALAIILTSLIGYLTHFESKAMRLVCHEFYDAIKIRYIVEDTFTMVNRKFYFGYGNHSLYIMDGGLCIRLLYHNPYFGFPIVNTKHLMNFKLLGFPLFCNKKYRILLECYNKIHYRSSGMQNSLKKEMMMMTYTTEEPKIQIRAYIFIDPKDTHLKIQIEEDSEYIIYFAPYTNGRDVNEPVEMVVEDEWN